MRIYFKSESGNLGYVCQMKRTEMKNFSFPYLCMNDVFYLYVQINGSSKGFSSFEKKAKEIAHFEKHYMFKDEEKLFNLFQERFSTIFAKRKIICFGQLMQL